MTAYVPDLPGCAATGATVPEVEAEIREAIEFHLEGMREDGLAVPEPSSQVEYIEIAAQQSGAGSEDVVPNPAHMDSPASASD